jgi:type IV secretory pathway VirJ component
MTSDLDHAIASDQMGFENLRATGDSADYEVRVAGWVDEAGAKRDDWVKNISDHCSLFVKLT